MNHILQFKPIAEEPLTLTASMFDVEYNHSVEGVKYSYWARIAPKAAYKKYFKDTAAYSNQLVEYSGNTISGVVSAKLITTKNVEVTITFDITGSGSNGCSGSVKSFSPTSIMIPGNQFDGHLTAESFIITPYRRLIDTSGGKDYYSYSARVDIKPDLDSFFMTKFINTNESEAKYGPVKYSIFVTFKTNKSEEVKIHFTLEGNGKGSCSATFNGVSPQWIDTPARPRLLKYGNKLIKIDIPTFYVWANEGGYHFADGIDPHPFFYKPGMTWRQWVASAYNPSPESIYIRENYIMFNAPYIIEGSSAIQDSVKPDDVIDPNHHYWLCDE